MKMRYKVILEKGKYALIVRGKNLDEYAVVSGLNKNKNEWDWTVSYWVFGQFRLEQSEALSKAIDCFRAKTKPNYISRSRLEELATLFKDGLFEDASEFAREYFTDICDMTENELEFFGIDEDSPTVNTKFENPMYNKGYDDGFSDAMNDKEE